MNIGNLYTVKNYFWLLFPTKETALTGLLDNGPGPADVAATAANWSRFFTCEVTYFSPNEYIVFLEEEGKLKKVLTSDGKLGWTWFEESYNDYFEELKAEP